MNIYVYMYIYIYIYIHISIHIFIHIYVSIYSDVYAYLLQQHNIQTPPRLHLDTFIHIFVYYTCIYIDIHAYLLQQLNIQTPPRFLIHLVADELPIKQPHKCAVKRTLHVIAMLIPKCQM